MDIKLTIKDYMQKLGLSDYYREKLIIPGKFEDPVLDFLEPFESYGVEWNVNDAATNLTRIGNADYHRTLPIQSKMGRVLLTDGGGEWKLDKNDSRYLADGVTPADLTGASGQYMVVIPRFYYKFEKDGDIRRLKIAQRAFTGYTLFKKSFISVAEACLDRDNLKLSSVVNYAPQFRGGGNQSAWDGQENSQLGMPVTSISRQNAFAWAQNRGSAWVDLAYHVYNAIRILYLVEYADRDTQLDYTDLLTTEGYRQGGLGAGVTTVSSGRWNSFSGYNPFVPVDATLDLGDHTGLVQMTINDFGGAPYSFSVPSYRGFQNYFGHLWQNANGVLVKANADSEGGTTEMYVSEDPATWSDSDETIMAFAGNISRFSGYVKDIEFPYMAPIQTGAGSTTYYADYLYVSYPSSGSSYRTLLLGGSAYHGAIAGAFFGNAAHGVSLSHASIVSRLCFLT